MKNKIIKLSKGFSLLELCIVISIMAVLAGSITPIFIRKLEIKAGEKTALEMSLIEQAASAYFVANKAWPANIQSLQSAGYLNSAWVTNNPWQNPYRIASTSESFTVSSEVPSQWTALVARDLPSAVISSNTVSSTIPQLANSNDSLPLGSIIMWSGSIASIPSGWALCDGKNGTPDLRDKFVVGASQDSAGISVTNVEGSLKKTGGYLQHYHLGPAHTHAFSATTGGPSSEGGVRNDYQNIGAAVNGHTHYVSGVTGSGGTGQTSSAGNIPPYYALCFIMRNQ